MRTPKTNIEELVARRASWINGVRARLGSRERRQLVSGDALLYLGDPLQLCLERGSVRAPRADLDGQRLTVILPQRIGEDSQRAAVERALTRWYVGCALADFEERVRAWATACELAPSGLLVRNQRTRWGSCSRDGVLRLNWRLVMAPPSVVDYVVVHELAHMRVPNHSAAFWAEVERFLPDYRERRAHLKRIGPQLVL
ncbi:MAG: hypothetical protein HW416_2041 [Chloroflexi bacterium]|nr:hypothetical protein [Chloroflexota bacterium]